MAELEQQRTKEEEKKEKRIKRQKILLKDWVEHSIHWGKKKRDNFGIPIAVQIPEELKEQYAEHRRIKSRPDPEWRESKHDDLGELGLLVLGQRKQAEWEEGQLGLYARRGKHPENASISRNPEDYTTYFKEE